MVAIAAPRLGTVETGTVPVPEDDGEGAGVGAGVGTGAVVPLAWIRPSALAVWVVTAGTHTDGVALHASHTLSLRFRFPCAH